MNIWKPNEVLGRLMLRSLATLPGERTEKVKKNRQIDFKKYNRCQVALRLAYFGEAYKGFAWQRPPAPTVEGCLVDTLKKANLIEELVNYSRCGRTDSGVSALGQVVSLQVRSHLLEGEGVIIPEGSLAHTRTVNTTTELPYMAILNSSLPHDIRVLGWTTVSSDFNARFSCQSRTYKYFFPLGDFSLEKMNSAAKQFVGEHDFRNFSRVDLTSGKLNFVRRILSFDFDTVDGSPPSSPHQICVATVTGYAFLRYQVRYMMAVLFFIGHGLEEESVISHMLDIQHCPCKPQYETAPPEPLILFDSKYDGMEWKSDDKADRKLINRFQDTMTQLTIRCHMMQAMFSSLNPSLSPSGHPASLTPPLIACNHRYKYPYTPLLKRKTNESIEDRLDKICGSNTDLRELLQMKLMKIKQSN